MFRKGMASPSLVPTPALNRHSHANDICVLRLLKSQDIQTSVGRNKCPFSQFRGVSLVGRDINKAYKYLP